MGRKFISQKKQTKEELFDSLVKNAIDFLDSSLDDLEKRPKNSIVDFYTWRRQKLSATPDLSGTVLPYVLFRTQR